MSILFNIISSSDFVRDGYGELIAFRTNNEGVLKEPLDFAIYEKAYSIFRACKPLDDAHAKELFLEKELHSIDPSLKWAFIPRALYELFCIEQCIEEEIDNWEMFEDVESLLEEYEEDGALYLSCPHQIAACKEQSALQGIDPFLKMEKATEENWCWHQCEFKDWGNDGHPLVKRIAHHVNDLLVDHLPEGHEQFLRFEEITALARAKLAFLKSMTSFASSDLSKRISQIPLLPKSLSKVFHNVERAVLKPLGINDEGMERIVMNAIALECSAQAGGHEILYRGAKLRLDNPWIEVSGKKVSYSLSFGTGIYSGAKNDPGATPFHYMRDASNEAFALLIPKKEIKESPFSIPETHAVSQFFGVGEKFHARTKAWTVGQDFKAKLKWHAGMNSYDKIENLPEHMKLDADAEEFSKKYRHYTDRAIDLKSLQT